MVFSSIIFLFFFFPAFFLCYYLTPRKYKNGTALIGSYLFYTWGAPIIAFLLFVSSVIDYIISGIIVREQNKKRKKQFLFLSVSFNILLLGYFKYANFFIEQSNNILQAIGFTSIPWGHVALPIGISFWTFQKISYMIDVYRNKELHTSTFTQFALYIALFPQLIAGPIIRYKDIYGQIISRNHTAELILHGLYRFAIGLGKKVLIADQVGMIANNVFALSITELTMPIAWIGVIAYAVQILFDFSGYSDMAIGIGQMMGFTFPENFNKPYRSKSITEFWRRWHMTLSTWMKDYLYIPLGGNRVSTSRMYINLWIVFLLSGLWHGANWTFILWGAFHGFFLMIDKIRSQYDIPGLPKFLQQPITFLLILISWVFFRSLHIEDALLYLSAMFGFGIAHAMPLIGPLMTNRSLAMLILGLSIAFLPKVKFKLPIVLQISFKVTVIIAVLIVATASIASMGFSSFLYFNF